MLAVIPLTKDAIHVYVGFVGLLVALIVFRRRLSSYQALIPGFLVSLLMEFFDLRDGYSAGGERPRHHQHQPAAVWCW